MSEQKRGGELLCVSCGQEAWLLRTPRYDGFNRVGDELSCSACGYVYEEEDELCLAGQGEAEHIFSAEDREEVPTLFDDEERRMLCRYCRHYVVNPFTQWCARHRKETEATDTCAEHEPVPDA